MSFFSSGGGNLLIINTIYVLIISDFPVFEVFEYLRYTGDAVCDIDST